MNPLPDPATRSAQALGPHGRAQRVDCRICHAATAEPCHDAGLPRDDPHHSRWMRYQRYARGHPFLGVVSTPVPGSMGAGDVVLCAVTADARQVDIIGDRLGRRFTQPTTVSAGAVEFRSFISESGGRQGSRRTQQATGA